MVNKWYPHLLHSASMSRFSPNVINFWGLGTHPFGIATLPHGNCTPGEVRFADSKVECLRVCQPPIHSAPDVRKNGMCHFFGYESEPTTLSHTLHYLDLFENRTMAPSLKISRYNTSHGHNFGYIDHVQTKS